MSIIEYGQTAEDHQGLLVLVRHTGCKLHQKVFNKVWERIQHLGSVNIQGHKRSPWVIYKRHYPKDNNEWGDFQAHRKTLGLISIGECSSTKEFEDLFDCYRVVKEEYASTLFNSRLIVFGMNTDGSPIEKNIQDDSAKTSEEEEYRSQEENSSTSSTDPGSQTTSTIDSPLHSEDSGVTSDASPTEPSQDILAKKVDTENSEGQITFISKKSTNKDEKKTEKKSSKKLEKNAPVNRTHSNSLSKESTGAEVVFFPSLEDSVDFEDKLREFITSLFFVLEGKRLDRSFERQDRMQLLCAPFEKKDYVGLDTDTKSFRRKCQGRLRKHLADLCLQAGIPGEAILHYQTAIDILRPVNDYLWIGACYEGLGAASVIINFPKVQANQLRRNFSLSSKRGSSMLKDSKMRTGSINHSYANGLQDLPDTVHKASVTPDDIIEKYKEALSLYSKFKNAAMIELEASLKASRVLISQEKYLQASDFLQNVIYINLHITDEDKINRYCCLSQLYSQVGFHRKAAFFKRIAAMQCVAPQINQQNWHQCYNLLMQCLDGYKIPLDSKRLPTDHAHGWPVLQSRVLNELVFSARKMGNLSVAVRHTTFLLHSLNNYLTQTERKEICGTLQQLTARCEGTSQSLVLENGTILPPVPLLHIPHVRSFKLMRLRPHLEPVKLKRQSQPESTGVFIFTPLLLGQSSSPENASKVDFRLVAKDLCEVQLQVCNSLADELKIVQMGLLTEGVEVETYPSNPSIPAESGPYLVKISGRPQSAGELTISGYSTHLLGVKSNCKLKDLPQLHMQEISVEVIPPLPQIQLTTSLPKAATFISGDDSACVVTSATSSLYAGQSMECHLTIQNNSLQPVEIIDVRINSRQEEQAFLSRVFRWCCDNINSQLPLLPNSVMCFTISIYGATDFLSSNHAQDSSEPKCIERLLRIEYSGGQGLEAGYCRRCAVSFSVDIQPSVIFHSWDVLPSESCDHCNLVFEVQNVSGHQLELQYSNDKSLVLGQNQIRRIDIEIERCIFPPEPEVEINKNRINTAIQPINHFSSYLNDFVDIRWTCAEAKAEGRVCIDYLVWTTQQLDLIRVSPITWDVRINGAFAVHQQVCEVFRETVTNIDVGISFKTEASDERAKISIHCYHGDVESDSLLFLGSDSAQFASSNQEPLGFQTSVLFLHEGLYRMEVTCAISSDKSERDFIYRHHPIQIRVNNMPT